MLKLLILAEQDWKLYVLRIAFCCAQIMVRACDFVFLRELVGSAFLLHEWVGGSGRPVIRVVRVQSCSPAQNTLLKPWFSGSTATLAAGCELSSARIQQPAKSRLTKGATKPWKKPYVTSAYSASVCRLRFLQTPASSSQLHPSGTKNRAHFQSKGHLKNLYTFPGLRKTTKTLHPACGTWISADPSLRGSAPRRVFRAFAWLGTNPMFREASVFVPKFVVLRWLRRSTASTLKTLAR